MNHRVIHRHRADHGGAFFTQFPAERLRVPVAGQVHDGFRPHVHRAHYLFHFHIVILAVAAHAQVHINFCFQHAADTVGIQAFVKGIRGNDNRSRCHPFPDKFRGTVFLCRHDFHLRGNDSFSRRFHLGKIFFCHFTNPFCRLGERCLISASLTKVLRTNELKLCSIKLFKENKFKKITGSVF